MFGGASLADDGCRWNWVKQNIRATVAIHLGMAAGKELPNIRHAFALTNAVFSMTDLHQLDSIETTTAAAMENPIVNFLLCQEVNKALLRLLSMYILY